MKLNRPYRRLLRSALAAAVTALTLVVNVPSAHAEATVGLTYGAPEISDDGDTATWSWTVTNGQEPVDELVVTHELQPQNLRVIKISEPCTSSGTAFKCAYGTLKPGESRTGSLVAHIPANMAGSVKLSGRATWMTSTAP
ncbi:hypothetical protein [Streptomyces sp. NPDC007905]|uniref:hypothetical protein n=1 Tax=Streptomyces sp. NPDC007905 TaxID=3364788 RepID=UPI0036E32698